MEIGKKLVLTVTALGFSSIITQLVLIREFLSIFYGNELIMGIIFANWLLLIGIGSYLGRYSKAVKNKTRLLIMLQIILAFLPVISVYLTRISRNIIFLPGELISPLHVFVFSLFMLLPFCLTLGFLLILACSVFSYKKDAEQIGKVYFWDSIGSITGGLIFSFVLIYLLNPFQTTLILLLANLFSASVLSKKKLAKILIILILIISVFAFFKFDLNKISTKDLFQNQGIIEQVNSRYGNLVVTKSLDQLNFFENGMALFSTDNTISNEETIHYTLVQHENPKNVLLISGGVSGTVKEILKYDVDRIDYVELDPVIISLGKKYTTNLEDKRIKIINQDGRLFVKQTKEKYDIVIIDLPDPNTAQVNRFYTIEFLKELKKKLNRDAVISLSISSSENYLSEEAKKFNSVIYTTLKKVFKNVIIIPGDENFYIASDKILSYDIARLIEEKGISTEYVNKNYLPGKITQERIDYVQGEVKEGKRINKDFNPVAYYYHLLFWKTKFEYNTLGLIPVIIAVLILVLVRTKPLTLSIAAIGFSAISLELVILSGFQIIYGYVYSMVGIIVTSFMIGIALGAYCMNKALQKRELKDFLKIQVSIIVYSALLPLILIALSQAKSELASVIIPLLTIVIGFLTGSAFPLASKLAFKEVEKTAGIMYSADLIGSCIGAVLVSVLLMPLLGLVKVCMMIALLNLVMLLLKK